MSALTPLRIRKALGDVEPFSEQKLRSSFERARIPSDVQDVAISHLQTLPEEATSSQVFSTVQEVLKDKYQEGSFRYNLKRAIMDLGPSGYPFEKYLGHILRHHGYSVAVSTLVRGKCVTHEVDVLASKDGKTAVVECKFHNQPGTRSDIKVALYVHARFQDISARATLVGGSTQNPYQEAWIVTNTKFTSDAIAYADCVGMRAIGWNHPRTGNLQQLVESAELYPITCLNTLSRQEIEELLAQEIVLVSDLDKPEAQRILGR